MPNNFTTSPPLRFAASLLGRFADASRRRAFSLMEVLLAVFILGIGLIMVATIFPVGADWTRQSTEATVAQTVAQNALSVIRTVYAPNRINGNLLYTTLSAPSSATVASPLVALPGLTNIPISERCYQFGNQSPFPAADPTKCTYFWTALARVQPGSTQSTARRYDLYILVFRKGDNTQIFTPVIPLFTPGATEFPSVRDTADPTAPAMSRFLEPTLLSAPYSAGTFNANFTPIVSNAVPPVGYIGIGQTSGTVFRQTVDINNSTASPRPYLLGQTSPTTTPSENVIFAAPADGTNASPLVYVYQTTLSF